MKTAGDEISADDSPFYVSILRCGAASARLDAQDRSCLAEGIKVAARKGMK